MKFYKPLFSIIIIVIQLALSLKSYYHFVKWEEVNPVLNEIICRVFYGDRLFFFVLIIGLFEMRIQKKLFKTFIRILLTSIVLGQILSPLIPIGDFFFAVYNTAWFSATVTVILFIFLIVKYLIKSIKTLTDNKN